MSEVNKPKLKPKYKAHFFKELSLVPLLTSTSDLRNP